VTRANKPRTAQSLPAPLRNTPVETTGNVFKSAVVPLSRFSSPRSSTDASAGRTYKGRRGSCCTCQRSWWVAPSRPEPWWSSWTTGRHEGCKDCGLGGTAGIIRAGRTRTPRFNRVRRPLLVVSSEQDRARAQDRGQCRLGGHEAQARRHHYPYSPWSNTSNTAAAATTTAAQNTASPNSKPSACGNST